MRIPLIVSMALLAGAAQAEPAYTPPPAEQVTGYSATLLPCKIMRDEDMMKMRGDKPVSLVSCQGGVLEQKTLRELSILRNTIYARYGWDGFRKTWLRDYFHQQPWFKPNPKFTYKLLSDIDRKNAHVIGTYEQSLTDRELEAMADEVYARRGKMWNDKPAWKLKNGKQANACEAPDRSAERIDETEGDFEARDCRFARKPWYKPNPRFTEGLLTAEDRIELGLISRARGGYAVDGQKRDEKEQRIDQLFQVNDLRAMSLRDLRVLRNTIYARHGRPFKSKILQEHFTRMPWYKIDQGYSDGALTAVDKRNIALIKSVENEFGGPLKDEDWLIEPAVDGA